MNRLGPKTHLFVLILASLLSTLVSHPLQAHLMVLASALYMLGNKLPRKALSFVLFYIVLNAVLFVLPAGAGTGVIILYTLARMFQMIMIGTVLMHSTPSSIMCAFERVPKPVLIMICILIRFFPVVLLEMKAIRDGIRARGIFPRWHSVAAYCSDAELIILDEPTSGLDGDSVLKVVAWVKQLAHAGKTVVLITHDSILSALASDQVIALQRQKGGKPIES